LLKAKLHAGAKNRPFFADTQDMKRVIIFCVFALILTVFCSAQSPQIAGGAFRQEGIASWYGAEFDGRPTASGEIFNSTLYTAAHPSLPFGTILKITNRHNNRTVTVRVNDRGPFVAARIIDLSRAAAVVLDMLSTGTAPVLVEAVSASDARAPSAPVAAPASAAAPVAVTPVEIPLGAPPISIIGGIPSAGTGKVYRLQVGAYKVPRNAVDAFEKVKNAGLNPAYEKNGDMYRVVLAGLRPEEIQPAAEKLGAAGFREAIIRTE
jgi:rare lipoprotein A